MHTVIRRLMVGGVVSMLAAACGLPFGLGQATTAQLLNGAADNIANAKSLEMKGNFTESSNNYTMDIEYQSTGPSVHMDITQGAVHVELLQACRNRLHRNQPRAFNAAYLVLPAFADVNK